MLRLAIEGALSVLAPPACAACDAPLARQAVFCGVCAGGVEPCPAGDEGMGAGVSAGYYGGPLSLAIQRLKFGGRVDLARPLGHLVLARLRSTSLAASVAASAELVVPVPLHPARLISRGYNQAALLARVVAAGLGKRYAPGLVAKRRATETQASLDAAARRENLRGVFTANGSPRARRALAGASILLVDDVRTTGTTLDEVRRTLMEAGAARVSFATVAQTP